MLPQHENPTNNSGYWEAGLYCAKIVPPSEQKRCLAHLLQRPFKARTESHKFELMCQFIERFRDLCWLFDAHCDLEDVDARQLCKREFFSVGLDWKIIKPLELKLRAQDWLDDWVKIHEAKPAVRALSLQQHIRESGKVDLRTVLDLIDASGLVTPFDYQTEQHNGTVFVDLGRHQQNAVLKIEVDFLPILKRTTPWILENNRLYRSAAKINRGAAIWTLDDDGQHYISGYEDGKPTFGKLPLHHLAVLEKYDQPLDGATLATTRFRSNDSLDWRHENLYLPCFEGRRDENGMLRGNAELDNRTSQMTDWSESVDKGRTGAAPKAENQKFKKHEPAVDLETGQFLKSSVPTRTEVQEEVHRRKKGGINGKSNST